jgi:hypothetical protein
VSTWKKSAAMMCFELAAQHGVLVSQHEQFGVLGGIPAQ